MKRFHLLMLTICLAALSTPAQVELRLLDGRVLNGRLRSLSADGALKFLPAGAAEAEEHTLSEVIGLRFGEAPLTTWGRDTPLLRFEISGGDVVYGTVIDGNFDEVRVEAAWGRMTIPLDVLDRVVILANATGIDTQATIVGDDGQDVLLVRSKAGVDRVHGSLVRFQRQGVLFEWGDGEESLFSYRSHKVATVALAEAEAPATPKASFVRVFFRDGSRLSGQVTREAGRGLVFRHLTGAVLEVNLADLAEVSVSSGRFVHLSDLAPAKVKETPYLPGGFRYGLNVDHGLNGRPLSIGRRSFPRGLSVHSRCEVSYSLNRKYVHFSAAFGLDGQVASRRVKGSVRFSVLLDGKVVFGPVLARAGEEPRWISRLNVAGGETLTLRADFGDNHHFNGWAVWGSPFLVKAKASE